MQFRISDTFTDSLTRLTSDEQKTVKTTAFDLQVNPANPGLQLHRIERCRDKNFWSVRAGRDIRVIVHKTDASLLLCFVDHHDKAYQWAEKRRLETHPRTGAAQLVEIRETVREIEVPAYAGTVPQPKVACLTGLVREDLLKYGVPEEWVDDCLTADEDSLFSIADRLPSEAAEALLILATGGRPEPRTVAAEDADPFSHPDAQRRFRVLDNAEELAAAQDKLVSLSSQFLLDEWNDVVDGWNLKDWPEYRDFKRLGRKTRLREADRKQVWGVFERLREALSRQDAKTMAMVYYSLTESTACPFHAVIVDECQDVSPAQLRFLCRVSQHNPGELFFAGDLGQRIFQTPFSWTSLGVDIRGRNRTLKINYRTSQRSYGAVGPYRWRSSTRVAFRSNAAHGQSHRIQHP